MPIGAGSNPSISIGGTTNVKIVSWDSTASLPAGANVIGTVGISSTANTITGAVTLLTGTATQSVTGAVTLLIGTATQSVSVANTTGPFTVTASANPLVITGTISDLVAVYQQGATTIAATGTGILIMGVQSGATTSRGWAFTTTAAGHVFLDNSVTMGGTVTVTGSVTNTIVASIPGGNQVIGTVAVSNIVTMATGTVTVVAIATTADSFAIPTGGNIRYLTASTGVQFLRISITTSGDSILVTSAANKSFVVMSLWLNGNGANAAVLASSASAKPLGGPIFIATSGVGMVLNNNDHGWFRTTVGDSLVINLASSGSCAGSLTYVAVTT